MGVKLPFRRRKFDSRQYWIDRYSVGGNSGSGSYGEAALWKSTALNDFVRRQGIQSVIELGCGDGNNLQTMKFPQYIGIDPSPDAIRNCLTVHGSDSSKSFLSIDPDTFHNRGALKADLALSMEVLLHLTEDLRFEKYLLDLFGCAREFVAIFSTASDVNPPRLAPHNRFRDHRPFVQGALPEWDEIEYAPTPTELDFLPETGFYFYRRRR
jgi:SAM-dependent methyltransferase